MGERKEEDGWGRVKKRGKFERKEGERRGKLRKMEEEVERGGEEERGKKREGGVEKEE